MNLAKLIVTLATIIGGSVLLTAQSQPNLENGFKNYGSYDGSKIDTVNLMNGNLILTIPAPFHYPQRGNLEPHYAFYLTSKNWGVQCVYDSQTGQACQWEPGVPANCVLPYQNVNGLLTHSICAFPSGSGLTHSLNLTVKRTVEMNLPGGGAMVYSGWGYSLVTWDLAVHGLYAISGYPDPNGYPTQFESMDGTGYHVKLSTPDGNGVLNAVVVTDGAGNQYRGSFPDSSNCIGSLRDPWDGVPSGGGYVPMANGNGPSDSLCGQIATITTVTDPNGNVFNLSSGADTLGKVQPAPVSSTDTSDCVSPLPVRLAFYAYLGPNGAANQITYCYSNFPIQTSFSQPNVLQAQRTPGANGQLPSTTAMWLLATIVFPDHSKLKFNYDGYGEVTYVGLPQGGSISYTWTEISFPNCVPADQTGVSRAVASRIVNDNNGNSATWNYSWGTQSNNIMANTVTDPLNNDTVHVFTADATGCNSNETRTQYYQGTGSTRRLLRQVDTVYSTASVPDDTSSGALGNVFATDVTTTVYPSGKVSKVHRVADPGLGTNAPIFGNEVQRLEYDWGAGAPGPLLREIDTTYQWQNDSRYLTAHLIDLPASVVIKDGGGCALAETDYTYDEAQYLTGTTISTQHVAAPNPSPVRGNQTTVTRWLAATSSCSPKGGTAVTNHTNWYDTGEPYQKIDPLGHKTTLSYDSAYASAYVTQTCSPQTGSVAHCVSGTYDFNTGVLTSLTNENATTQASGTTKGDSAHTTNFGYDSMFRITSALAPPDPANGSAQAQTSFNFSTPNIFPLSVQRTKSITTALSDSATNFFDGLGRANKSQHVLPNGTATVDTVFDPGGHPATVSNPYFTTADPTYGITTSLYDALDRVTQTAKQDGSVSKMAYNVSTSIAVTGDCTQTTDEAGKQRGACSDALGRVVEVDEPTGAPVLANYHATMQQDGNFVIYDAASSSKWSTGTGGTNASSVFMQDDGNLVLYVMRWLAGTYATPIPGSYPISACSIGTYLVAGQIVPSGKCIVSPHNQYFLYMAPDGNLYIYDWAHGTGTWGPGTQGHPGAYATLQTDGNFVVYTSTGVALWSSGTAGTGAERMDMEDDGRIIIYKSAWNSGTSNGQFNGTVLAHPGCDVGIGTGWTGVLSSGQCFVSPNGRFELLMQPDGNMVIYDCSVTPNAALWSSATALSPADPGFAMRTLYAYDALGNLLRVDQKGTAPSDSTQWRTRTFTYDSLSRLLTATNPESGSITYSYDADGELLQKTSPAPNQTGTATQTVSYCYDVLHRVTGKGYGAQTCPLATPVVTYAYDSGTNAKGHLTSLTDQAGTATYTYDVLGRLATETRTLTGANNAAIPKNLSYSYNLDGSLKTLTYPSGNIITYTPDSAGRITSAVDTASAINYVTSATYGPDSALTGFVSGNSTTFAGITNGFSYNKRLQPVAMSAAAPSQTVFSIGYDFHIGNGTSGADNGNVFGITNYKDTTRSQTFTYDLLNRLISAQNAGTDCAVNVLGGNKKFWGNNYGYDAWGNLLSKSVTKCSSEALSVVAGNNNRLTGAYLYDAAGNMTHDATSGLNYTFDQENRITGAAGFAYTYDGDGNRVRKSNGNLAANGTLYWAMTPGVVAETDLAGTLKSEYVFFDGERVARRDGATGTGGVFYYFSDHLKTASVITDSAGVIKAESDYYPWGGELQFANNDSNDYKFTGKKRDIETGLDYFSARYYSNGLGRWVSADWSPTPVPVPYANFGDPQSLNLYSYVRGVPTSRIDLDGHENLKPGDWGEKNDSTPTEFDHKMSGLLLDGFSLVTGPLGRAFMAAEAISDFRSGNKTSAALGLMAAIPGERLIGSVWKLGNFARGIAIETALGKNLAAGFPVIDKFLNGTATSIKSIDLTAKTYQDTAKLAGTLDKYVDKVANFNGARYGTDIVKGSEITARELQVAIPKGSMSVAQQKVFDAAAGRAAQLKQPVKLSVTQVD